MCPLGINHSFWINCDEEEETCPEGVLFDIYAGVDPGNFGWMAWDGCTDTPCLCVNLDCGPLQGYTNAHDPNDHELSICDWVQGSTGVVNAQCVREDLDRWLNRPITIIVWDASELAGANVNYHVSGFAKFILRDYHLPHENVIWGEFVEWVDPSDLVGGGEYHLRGVKLIE